MSSKKLYSAKCLRNSSSLRKHIPNKQGVYKWWCNKEDLMKIMNKLKLDCNECIKDIEKIDNVYLVCTDKNSKKIKGSLYCIYVGESTNLHRRILSNHIGGNIKKSTLRYTLSAVLFGSKNERKVDSIINKYFIEWEKCRKKTDCFEIQNKYINKYFRPLNNKDICPNNKKYNSERYYEPYKNGNGKRSVMINELRAKLKVTS